MSIGHKLYKFGLVAAGLCIVAHVYAIVVAERQPGNISTEIAITVSLLWLIIMSYLDNKSVGELSKGEKTERKFLNPFIQRISDLYKVQQADVHAAVSFSKQFRNEANEGNATVTVLAEVTLLSELIQDARNNSDREKWHNEGLARLADVVRADKDFDQLIKSVLSFVVGYSNSKQGLLFVLNHNEQTLKVVATYASDEMETLTIPIGEGIVGQSFLNGQSVFLEDLPSTFYKIKSGLGTSIPKAAAVLPLVSGKEITGVLEIATFHNYPLYVRDWLEKCTEVIGALVKNTVTNEKIKRLLHESEAQTKDLTNRELELERVKIEQTKEIARLNQQHEQSLKLVEEKIHEVEVAKADVERMRGLEQERQKKQNETQSKIIQATLDKFKVQETQLKQIITERDVIIQRLQNELKQLNQTINPN
jgi:putative methionine-R-sulfoxide reductase with GAF domain